MVSTSGAQLLPREAIKHLSGRLLRRTTLLTPNVPEAKLLLAENGLSDPETPRTVDELVDLAQRLRVALGPAWVLVKGGHVPFRASDMTATAEGSEQDDGGAVVVDVLVGPGGDVVKVQSKFQKSTSTHGTGCSLACKSAAIRLDRYIVRSFVCTLTSSGHSGYFGTSVPRKGCPDGSARGVPVHCGGHPDGAAAGRRQRPAEPLSLVVRPAVFAVRFPSLWSLIHLPKDGSLTFGSGYFIEYLLERPDVQPVWKEFVHHPFVMALGNGTLPLESFKGYIIQDYIYLV